MTTTQVHTKDVNADFPVYFSYAHSNGVSMTDLEEPVNQLCSIFSQRGIVYWRDKEGLCCNGTNFGIIAEQIGAADVAVVIVSRRYLESLNCMYEWYCICAKNGFKADIIQHKVKFIFHTNSNIKTVTGKNNILRILSKQLNHIASKQITNMTPAEILFLNCKIEKAIEVLYYIAKADMQEEFGPMIQTNYESIVDAIETRIIELKHEKNNNLNLQQNSISKQSFNNINFNFVKKIVKNVCNKVISMKYGIQGINLNYLSSLCPVEKISGLNNTYQALDELINDCATLFYKKIGDRDIRILLTGDIYSGRSTHLLYFYKKMTEEGDKIIFYLSPIILNNQNPIDYIVNTYLKNIPFFKRLNPEDAFMNFKKMVGKNKRIVIIFDDYDNSTTMLQSEIDKIFKFENKIIDNLDIIIKVRYRDSSWPLNYLEIESKGISDKSIKNIFKQKNISFNHIQVPSICLKSPKLLKMLVEEFANEQIYIPNAGQLIRTSIANRVETASHVFSIDRDRLYFSVFALLPHIAILKTFDKQELYALLPSIIQEIIELHTLPESFEVSDYLDSKNIKRSLLFKDFFWRAIVQAMGLLRESRCSDSSKVIYKWQDETIGNLFYAIGIINLLSSKAFDKALVFLNEITEHLLSGVSFVEREEVIHSSLVYFDRAKLFLELANKELLITIQKKFTKQTAFLFCGLAMMYELLGNESEKYFTAIKAIDLLSKEYTLTETDSLTFDYYINKMSYYVIKCSDLNIPNLCDSLKIAHTCLNKLIEKYEHKKNNLSVNEKLELSKAYGNMGAYYLRIKEFNVAILWHKKSLQEKKQCLPNTDNMTKKVEILEGIRRSLVSLGTDCYKLGLYKESIKYQDKAIKIGQRIHSRFRYESYSRKVGSYIKMYNKEKKWSIDNASFLLSLLLEDIQIMGNYLNRNEIFYIYNHAIEILSSITKENIHFRRNGQSFFEKTAIKIEHIYNQLLWKNNETITKIIMEDSHHELYN